MQDGNIVRSIGWERAKAVVQMLSLLAIPVVIPISLAVYTAKLQTASQKESFDRDYVQLAVSVLKDDKPETRRRIPLFAPGLWNCSRVILQLNFPTICRQG
jgi:hypothetical protein